MKLWRGQPDNWTFKPTARELAHAWMGMGVMFVVVACYEFWFPSPHTGRWAWLHKVAVSVFGPQGSVVLYSIVAAAFVFFGIRKYRSRSGQNVA